MNVSTALPICVRRGILPAAILLVVSLGLIGCGSDLSTPEATINTAQDALAERNWDRLYTTTSTNWRKRYLPKWRSHLRNLLRRTDGIASVDASTVDRLSKKQVFRTYLEALSRSKRTKRLVNAYASADFTIEQRKERRTVIRARSPLPLPRQQATLKRRQGKWKFDRLGR